MLVLSAGYLVALAIAVVVRPARAKSPGTRKCQARLLGFIPLPGF